VAYMHNSNQIIIQKFVGSIITSLGFVGFIVFGQKFFQQEILIKECVIMFLIAFAGYVYFRLSKNKWIKILSIFLICWVLYLLWRNRMFSAERIIIIIFNVIIMFLYHSHLRKMIFVKPFIIGLSWVSWLYFFTLNFHFWFYLQQFIFISLLTIPFDISTIDRDKIITLPKKYGKGRVVVWLRILSIMFLLLSFEFPLIFTLNAFIIGVILNVFLHFNFTFQWPYVYIFYDGIIFLQMIVLWGLEKVLGG